MLENMHIESINVGNIETIGRGDKSMQSGICKRPITGDVYLSELGIADDAIVDTKYHGGPDQAIYAYSADDYDWWQRETGKPFGAGLFGENLTIRGLPSDMSIGDRLLIGEVVLEATSPRIPCGTLATRMQDSSFGVAFRHAERPGVYFRVLNEGSVAKGDSVTLVESPVSDVSIVDIFRFKYSLRHTEQELRRFLEAPIAERMREEIELALAKITAA